MSPNITSKSSEERVLWQHGGKILKAKVTQSGDVSLVQRSEVDGCGARVIDVPARALSALIGLLCVAGASRLSRNGKQLLRGDFHLADCVTPEAAAELAFALESVAMIEVLRSWEGDIVTVLPDNPEALTADTQAAVEVNADWTHFRERRFYGQTWHHALRSAAAAREQAINEAGGDQSPAEQLEAITSGLDPSVLHMHPDVHEALLAASGQSKGPAA